MSQIFPPTPGSILQGPVLETFEPQHCLIADVTTAVRAVVTTETNHNYYSTMVVRVIVPNIYGMTLYVQTPIIVISDTEFETEIDTSNIDAFVVPVTSLAFTPAQVVPMTGITRNIS